MVIIIIDKSKSLGDDLTMNSSFVLFNFQTWFSGFRQKFYKWFTAEGVEYLDQSTYMYKPMHIAIILSVLALTLIVFFAFRKKSEQSQRNFLIGIAVLMITCEIFTRISKLLFHADLGVLTLEQVIKDILPIHFCSVMIWVLIFAVLFDKRSLLSFGAVCGLIGCAVYLAYPIEGLDHSFFNIRMLNSPLTHGLGFVVCMNLFLWGFVRLDIKDIWKTYILLSCMVIYGGIMNILLPGENYMFIVTNPTPINTGKIPYQIPFVLVAILIVALIYLTPYWIGKLRNKRRNKKATQNI